jgi:hypothetical protein
MVMRHVVGTSRRSVFFFDRTNQRQPEGELALGG